MARPHTGLPQGAPQHLVQPIEGVQIVQYYQGDSSIKRGQHDFAVIKICIKKASEQHGIF